MSFLPYGMASTASWSSATGASVVVHAAFLTVAVATFSIDPVISRDIRAEHLITIDRLDPDVLAGLIAQQGALLDDPDGVADDTALRGDAAVPDTVSTPAAPDSAEPDPQIAALLPPDDLDDAVQPPSIPDDLVVEQPVAIPAQELPAIRTPDLLAPVPFDADSPLAGAAASGAALAAVPTNAALQPVPTAVEVVTARGDRQGGLPVSAPVAAPPSEQDLALGDLAARIAQVAAEPCLVALPRRDGTDGVGLELIASTDTAMARFANDLLGADAAQIRQVRTLVDQLQCAALGFLRETATYPVTRIGVALEADVVPSGGILAGDLRGGAGRYVTLLVIDNNGVVQDVQRFTSTTGAVTRFEIPVTRNAPLRETRHLLLALATDAPALTIRARAGLLAADVFASAGDDAPSDAAFGLVAFVVQ